MPVKDMIVKQVSVKYARPYIATFHYSKTMPDSTRFVFAGYYDDKLAGIVCYGMGASKSQYTSLIPDIKKGEYLELTRLWSPDGMPKNTESKLISESLRMLPPEIKLVVSFADSNQNHVGTVYQATNWHYVGQTNGGKVLITEDGTVQHTRLIGVYRKRHPELSDKTNEEIMQMYGWKYGEGGKKHKYCILLGDKREKKRNFQYIKDKILPYPKLSQII